MYTCMYISSFQQVQSTSVFPTLTLMAEDRFSCQIGPRTAVKDACSARSGAAQLQFQQTLQLNRLKCKGQRLASYPHIRGQVSCEARDWSLVRRNGVNWWLETLTP